MINSGKSNAKEWSKIVNSLNGQPKQMATLETNCMLLDDEWLAGNEIARQINEYFVNISGKVKDDFRSLNYNSTESETHLPLIDQNVVLGKMKEVKNGKASKDIPQWILKEGRYSIVNPLTNIINSIFMEKRFPNCWKIADIIPIEKKKPLLRKSQLRPISILNGAGKILEKVISDYYKQDVNLNENQYAYVENAGSTVALIAMLDDWTHQLYISGTMAVRLLLVDMTKAFDRVDRNILAK